MRILLAAFLGMWCAMNAAGQVRTNAQVNIVSISRQFIIHGVPLPQPASSPSPYILRGGAVPVRSLPSGDAKESDLLRLDPSFLAISCERIKQLLLTELELKDAWRGQISLNVNFTLWTNRPVDIQASHYDEGWQYRIMLPDEIGKKRLVRAIVHTLLLEMAHRQNPNRQGEIPLWLSEGLTQHLLGSSSLDLTPRPFTHSFKDERKLDPLQLAQAQARMHETLSFNELGLPTPEMLTGEKWNQYQISAQLFMAELLRIKGGKALLNTLIARLPYNLNWQVTFLQVYGAQFQSLLEVEKWWALCVANAQGLTQVQGWSHDDTWEKLDEIMHVPALVRAGTNTLPARSSLSMSQLVQLYDFATQQRAMRERIGQLRTLALVSSPSLRPLVQRCGDTLESYLLKRERAGSNRDKKGAASENLRFFANQAMAAFGILENQIELARNPAVQTQR
jgi:hypothetical protein